MKIDSINKIAENMEVIATSLSSPESFWNTQWFAALIGATTALLVAALRDIISKRNKVLKNFYDKVAENGYSLSLDSIGQKAAITSYGHTRTKDGVSTEIPEKKFSEKVVIELRRNCKYWRLPISKIKYMFQRYEKLLKKIPSYKDYHFSQEYKEADEYFKKIMELVYKKTGESKWTAR